MQFQQMIDNIMRERNISAYQMSKDTGISDRLIGYWRKGEKMPGAENILIIATYFNVSTDYLLTGQDPLPKDLASDEAELLNLYRKLEPTKQLEYRAELKGYIKAKEEGK